MYIVILLDYYFVIVFCSNIWKVERAARDQNVILHKNCTHVTYWCIKNQFFRCGDSYCLRFNIIVFLAVWSNKEYCWALKSKDIYLCLYHWQICIKMALAAGLSIRLMRDFVATLCLGVCIWLQKCTKVTKGAGWEGGRGRPDTSWLADFHTQESMVLFDDINWKTGLVNEWPLNSKYISND